MGGGKSSPAYKPRRASTVHLFRVSAADDFPPFDQSRNISLSVFTKKILSLSLSGACHEDVAASTSRRHAGLSIARRLAVTRPKLSGRRDHPQPFSARFASVFQFFVAEMNLSVTLVLRLYDMTLCLISIRLLQPSIASISEHWIRGVECRHTTAPVSHTKPSPHKQ